MGWAAPGEADQSADARARSLQLFKDSAEHYQAGRYAVAVALLEEAYALYPEPKLLYNLGRAREAEADVEGALEAYQEFLRQLPDSERRDDVRRRMQRLHEIQAMQREQETSQQTVDASGDGSAETESDAQPAWAGAGKQPSVLRRAGPWVLVGSGAATLVTALGLGLKANARHRAANAEVVHAQAVRLQDEAERRAITSNVLWAVGAGLAVAGTGWLVFGRRAEQNGHGGRQSARAWALRLRPMGFDCTMTFH